MILVVGVSFPWTQQSWHQGGPPALRPTLLIREKSLLVPMDLCEEKQSRIWVTMVFTGGNCSFLWSFAGSTVDVLWAHWYTLDASERGGEKSGSYRSDLSRGGNWKQIGTKSQGLQLIVVEHCGSLTCRERLLEKGQGSKLFLSWWGKRVSAI